MNETVTSSIQEVQKSQFLRIVDVIFLGPLMIYSARYLPNNTLKSLMYVSGSLVIINNLNNYLKNKPTA